MSRAANVIAVLAASVAIASCGGTDGAAEPPAAAPTATATPSPATEAALLRRPLDLPNLGTNGECPVTSESRAIWYWVAPANGDGPVYGVVGDGYVEFAPGTPDVPYHSGPVNGEGPVYAVLFDGRIGFLGDEGDGWASQKILWMSDDTYDGPALVRGRRIDGAGEARFRREEGDARELFLVRRGWAFIGAPPPLGEQPPFRMWPSTVLVRDAGCYAFQIDGLNFSTTVVIRAEMGLVIRGAAAP